jgi:hypothetical protein
MKPSWSITPDGEVVLLEPERWLFEAGDWDGVERTLDVRLPGDYKALIGDGLACVFDAELFIASPFDPNRPTNLVYVAAQQAWGLAYLRHHKAIDVPIAIFPEPGGLLGWGMDGGGGSYHWDTTDPSPDRWTVAVTGRSVFDPDVQAHPIGLVSYLDGLASGAIRPAALSEWPRPGAKTERRRSGGDVS